jgi:hypothetical protein
MGRTETDRWITNEPWSSMQEDQKPKKTKEKKTLLGEEKEVCSKTV